MSVLPTAIVLRSLDVYALAAACKAEGVTLHDRLVLSGLATDWLRGLRADGAHICPACLSLWTTAEKLASCPHKPGERPEHRKQIANWLDLAEQPEILSRVAYGKGAKS